MRKLFTCLLALLLAAFPALGEETLETATETHSAGLAVEVTGMALLDEWDGETSQTHVFLAVYATLTNWNAETLTLANALRAELSYEGAYVFEAELAFPVEEMEQLVRVDGALVFRIPTMVAEAAPEYEEASYDVVRTKRFAVKPMSVEDAITQMELLGHDFFLFLNEANSELNVLYRRVDGSYGLLQPEM